MHTLVWFEEFANVREAIQREKTLKHYVRAWKINLIERTNPHWVDLYPTLPGVAPVPQLVPLERWIHGSRNGSVWIDKQSAQRLRCAGPDAPFPFLPIRD